MAEAEEGDESRVATEGNIVSENVDVMLHGPEWHFAEGIQKGGQA